MHDEQCIQGSSGTRKTMNAIKLDRVAMHIESARRQGARLASLSAQHAGFDIDAGHAVTRLLQQVETIVHAFEIVPSPYPGWQFSTADAVVARSLHGLLLLGTVVPVACLGPGLGAALSVTPSCNGERIDQGTGATVLGSPLQALAHLQRTLAQAPPSDALLADAWISTGTITAAWPVYAGQDWRTTIEGLALPGLRSN
jgi:2-keto-4-pentenoate hydratase